MTHTTTFSRPTLVALMVSAMTMLACTSALADADFEDLTLGSESYWNGADRSGTPETVSDPWAPPDGTMDIYRGGFTSRGIDFHNNYNSKYFSWDTWAYSNTTDTNTAGYTNQYSAYAGGGVDDGDNIYGVYCQPSNITPTITGITPGSLEGAYFTNTTYAALSMLNGDGFAKEFGGDTGDDPDWFMLTIEGFDANDTSTGTVDFYLADYRFANNDDDYIVDEWTWVDMSGLGDATQLAFTLSSSDASQWGMNTPSYFAMDRLVAQPTPEPASLMLLLAGAMMLVGWRRRG